MQTKIYPKMTIVSMSTIVTCAKCHRENGVHENMYEDGVKYYHLGCVSGDTKKAQETKVHELHLNDDLSVKSEGR